MRVWLLCVSVCCLCLSLSVLTFLSPISPHPLPFPISPSPPPRTPDRSSPAGTSSDIENADGHADVSLSFNGFTVAAVVSEAYSVPARLGLLSTFHSPSTMTALNIVHRIMLQREQFQKRYDKKSKAEDAYVAQKSYVQEG